VSTGCRDAGVAHLGILENLFLCRRLCYFQFLNAVMDQRLEKLDIQVVDLNGLTHRHGYWMFWGLVPAYVLQNCLPPIQSAQSSKIHQPA
jgi:hypothetical protein